MTGGPDELDLAPVEGGTRLRLKVKAGARKDGILGVHAGALKLSVTTAPEKGKANRAVLRLLAGHLGLAPSELEITSGSSAPDKTVRVPLPARELVRRLLGSPGRSSC